MTKLALVFLLILVQLPAWASYTPGVVTSGATATKERVERVRAVCSGTASITTQSGSWISSITNGAESGECTLNFTAGIFSAAPTCTCTASQNSDFGSQGPICYWETLPTTSLAKAQVYTTTSGKFNATIDVICMGPR